ncbi:MAG TPA: HNH endonuclease signature motif containing protein [Planctomicrobium sp.]|nr:HNH endonuclease signature motif containing protein [Planctomicrobium sp.]
MRSDLVGQSKANNGGIAHCAYCRCQLSKSRTRISHIVPPSQGGETDVKNVVLVCPDCCKAKRGRTLREWTERLNDQLDGVHSLITSQDRKAEKTAA